MRDTFTEFKQLNSKSTLVIGASGRGKTHLVNKIINESIKNNHQFILMSFEDCGLKEITNDFDAITLNELTSWSGKNLFIVSQLFDNVDSSEIDYLIRLDYKLSQVNQQITLLLDDCAIQLQNHFLKYLTENEFKAIRVVITAFQQDIKYFPNKVEIINLD